MARRQTEADKRFAKLVKNYYLDDAEARTPRETEWNRAYKRILPSYIDQSKVKGPFKIKVPYCWRTLEVQIGQLMSQTDANGRWAFVRSTTPEHGDIGEIVSDALEFQFRYKTADLTCDNEMQMETAGRLGLGYGNGAALVEWNTDTKTCQVTAFDPFDLFLDWKHGRHIILRRVVTLAELEVMCRSVSEDRIEYEPDPMTGEEVPINLGPRDGGKALTAFRKVLRATKDGTRTGWLHENFTADHSRARQSDANRVEGDDDGQDDYYVSAKDDPYNARVTVLEYHETGGSNPTVAWVLPSFGGPEDDLVIRAEAAPYGCCQIVPFVPRPIDKEQYGLGIPEVVGHTNEAMDVFYRAALRYYVRVADPAVLYRKGLRLKQEYLRSQSGISIPVDDTVADMRYMEPPHNPGMHQAAFLFARAMADLGTGESEQRRGQVGGASSATEAAIAEAASTMTDRRIFWRWRRFVEQVGRVMLAIMKVHVTEDTMIPVVGRRAAMFRRLKPEFLRGDYEVVFGGNSAGMTPVQRQAGFRQIAQTYAQSGVVDIAALARADLHELGVPDPDRFLTVKSRPPSVSPRHEHMALFDFAEEIEVSPDDDHMAHVLAHLKEQQKRLGHPAAPLMQQHIAMHMAAIQAQAAAQMQAAGPQAGPAPFSPEQAGMPGQPAAFTPATAGLNDQRQMSNGGAPGRSPGPSVVPNRAVGALAMGGPQR